MGLAYVLLKGQAMGDRQARLWVTAPWVGRTWRNLQSPALPAL
jgi:hypothetical protein